MQKTYDLEMIAARVMTLQGLQPVFSPDVFEQLRSLRSPAKPTDNTIDLKSLLWCSIDNDDSRDLDQVTYAEKNENGTWTIWIGVADVDALVKKDSAIDQHAAINTTSVYTPAKIFPMLPEDLSTNLTSLNESEERLALVIKINVDAFGEIDDGQVFPGEVINKAKLTYNGVGAWLEGTGPIPEKVKKTPGLEEVLKCHYEVADKLKERRHQMGALTLESPDVEAKVQDDQVKFELPSSNFAHQIIENFMIAANRVMANYFRKAKIPSLRRVVKTPKNWSRIIEVAQDLGESLPADPDPRALDQFLIKMRDRDPESFPDLSLTVIKLLGRGEYIVEYPSDKPVGHFGLALQEYSHTTAPNRRYPDLLAQRQFKASLNHEPQPYTNEDLEMLAAHCTQQEDAATKVERHLVKSAAALLLVDALGTVYNGVITGASEKGTWVRVFNPPVEGKVIHGYGRVDVGDKVKVKLVSVDVPKGFIDFIVV